MTKNRSLCLVVFISACIIGWLYSDLILHLNDSLFANKGDGIKNYFNYLYHMKHDSGYFAFDGMNYPYGEAIFMVDGHPLLSNILKLVSRHIFDLSPYSVGILNFAMLASLVVCAVFVYLILDFYRHPWPIAIVGAISIAFLSSNAILMKFGHYALSYSCFFPIAWFLILKFQSSPKKTKYSVFILLNTLFWFYTHTYLGFIILGFTFLFHLFSFLLEKAKRNNKSFVPFLIQVVVPGVFVYAVIRIFDSHVGRIEMPYIHDYKASIYSVFFPNHSYLRPLYSAFIDLSPQESEPWGLVGNYIGFTTNLVLIGVIIYGLVIFAVGKKELLKTILTKNEAVMLLAATALLLYSMAIPFRFDLDFLLPPAVKQFSGLGRFAWPFYFVVCVLSLNMLRGLFKKKNAAFAVVLISVLVLFTEGMSYHLALSKEIPAMKNIFHRDSEMKVLVSNISDIDFSEYQAVVPIPFYHKYISLHSFEWTPKAEALSMSFSYATGIPLMSAMLSRSSVYESKKILQLFAPPHYKKEIVSDLNDSPILLFYTKENHSHLESELLKKSRKIFENGDIELYHLSLDALCPAKQEGLDDFIENRDAFTMDENSGYLLKDSFMVDYKSFDDSQSDRVYRGTGALSLTKNEFNVIYRSSPGQFTDSLAYNLSFWYYNHLYDQSFNTMWLEMRDSLDGFVSSYYFDPVKSNVYDGNWAFNELQFTPRHKNDYVVLCAQGQKLYSDLIYIDELLLRPEHQDIYRPFYSDRLSGEVIIKNNEAIGFADSGSLWPCFDKNMQNP